jgi:hypothetical protein
MTLVAFNRVAALLVTALLGVFECGCKREDKVITFNKHVAPIVINNCASCHRPGQAGPFPLLTYEDAKKHASQIAEVTASRYMPPWLPEHAELKFQGDRSLTDQQIRLIQRWVEQGALEGNPGAHAKMPKWPEGWQLGRPDLVVTMSEAYQLPASGRDLYRNFVVPVPLASNRFVRAIEFKPGSKSVHHAFVRIDHVHESRRLDAKDPEPGFGGMHTPPGAQSPDGFFLSWQPGKVPSPGTAGLSWLLEKNSDLVLQVHMQPVGRPEAVQCSVGLYFTDQPPSLLPMKIGIRSFKIDIPAGATNHTIEESYVLPVPAELLAILPHAHYLGHEMKALATLPNGTEKPLLSIKRWDFNWQGEYRYKEPVKLPKGTRITMHYSYDNSTNNVRNPNHPPQKVSYGINSTDEMAELWLQVLLANAQDQKALAGDLQKIILSESILYNQYLLRLNPADGRAHSELGKTLLFMNRKEEAEKFLIRATQLEPDLDDPHYFLGVLFRMQQKLQPARLAFEMALRLNPENAKAHGNLGLVLIQIGDPLGGKQHLEAALRLNPEDQIARETLAEVNKTLGGQPTP